MKKGIRKKIVLRFVSILFLIFEKRKKEKNCVRYFEIIKYAFLMFGKGISKKIVPRISTFVSMLL